MPLASRGQHGSLGKPTPVHRLDAATGGLLLLAKTKAAEAALKDCFARRTCRKRYRAILDGELDRPSCRGEVRLAVRGKEAMTGYEVVRHVRSRRGGWISVVDLYPVTGRKHQLRKHMKSLGCAILGDARYGFIPSEDNIYSRLCLWHMEISFPHPVTGQNITVAMDEPEWLKFVIKEEEIG